MRENEEIQALLSTLQAHPDIFEAVGDGCDDDVLDEFEELMGISIPSEIEALLQFADGSIFHARDELLHMASMEELLQWNRDRLLDDLEVIPFGHNGHDFVFLLDHEANWGAPSGGVYRLKIGHRTVGGQPIQDAIRLVDSMGEFLNYLAAGKTPW